MTVILDRCKVASEFVSYANNSSSDTASNVGSGAGVFKTKTSGDFKFKSIVAGSGVTVTPGTDEITLSAEGGGGGSSVGSAGDVQMADGSSGFQNTGAASLPDSLSIGAAPFADDGNVRLPKYSKILARNEADTDNCTVAETTSGMTLRIGAGMYGGIVFGGANAITNTCGFFGFYFGGYRFTIDGSSGLNTNGYPIIGEQGVSSPYSVHGDSTVDMGSDDYSLTAAEYSKTVIVLASGVVSGKTLTLPSVSSGRGYWKVLENQGAFDVTVSIGSGTDATLAAGAKAFAYVTSNGVFLVDSGGSSTASPGGDESELQRKSGDLFVGSRLFSSPTSTTWRPDDGIDLSNDFAEQRISGHIFVDGDDAMPTDGIVPLVTIENAIGYGINVVLTVRYYNSGGATWSRMEFNASAGNEGGIVIENGVVEAVPNLDWEPTITNPSGNDVVLSIPVQAEDSNIDCMYVVTLRKHIFTGTDPSGGGGGGEEPSPATLTSATPIGGEFYTLTLGGTNFDVHGGVTNVELARNSNHSEYSVSLLASVTDSTHINAVFHPLPAWSGPTTIVILFGDGTTVANDSILTI